MTLLRRRYLVRSFQYRLIAFQACYLFVVVAAVFWLGVMPRLEGVQDPALAEHRRVEHAHQLLALDHGLTPVLGVLVLAVFIHAVLVSHRLAGPLYRFVRILRSLAGGDLSMHVRIRPRDYLQEEARELADAIESLRDRFQELRARSCELDRALERMPSPTEGVRQCLEDARAAAGGIRARLDDLVLDGPEAVGGRATAVTVREVA